MFIFFLYKQFYEIAPPPFPLVQQNSAKACRSEFYSTLRTFVKLDCPIEYSIFFLDTSNNVDVVECK